MELNKAQSLAVHSPPNAILQILAGPGSGKTKVLTHRVCFLLEQGLKPENIILTTFTNKAANEMKERIGKLSSHGVESKLISGTFHSICRRYLAKYGSFINLKRNFTIADTDESKNVLKLVIEDIGSQVEIGTALNRISAQKSNRVSADTFYELAAGRAYAHGTESLDLEVAKVYRAYENQLKLMNLLDFDDLLLRTCELLEKHPKCIANVQHVLVDEFQDTNVVQYQLMRLFAQKCQAVSIVGDPDQGIYGWRNANAGNLAQMRSDYGNVKVINLEENYRSSQWVLKFAMAVIEQDTERFAKKLIGTRGAGCQPVLRTLANAHVEARWIAREIKRVMCLTGGLIKNEDCAILVRTGNMTRPIESALTTAGLKYRMVGGLKFFDRMEIKDMLAYLRVILSLEDSAALQRILNVPNRRLGKDRIKLMLKEAENTGKSMWDVLSAVAKGTLNVGGVDVTVKRAASEVIEIVSSAREEVQANNLCKVSAVLDYVREHTMYDEYLFKKFGGDASDRVGNVLELSKLADELENVADENALPELGLVNTAEETNLAKFLGNVSLMTDTADNKTDVKYGIVISTIHASKGLEWPVVFIPGVYQGSIPHMRNENVDEERRLLYVAATRAQALLYLSQPESQTNKDEKVPLKPSPFIQALKGAKGPKAKSILAEKGGSIDADVVAKILKRPPPSKEEIKRRCATLTSLDDEEKVEYDGPKSTSSYGKSSYGKSSYGKPSYGKGSYGKSSYGKSYGGPSGGGYRSQPEPPPKPAVSQTGVGRAPISGFSSSLPSTLSTYPQSTVVPSSAPMGFMTSREALAILPAQQLNDTENSKKRKADPNCPTKGTKARQLPPTIAPKPSRFIQPLAIDIVSLKSGVVTPATNSAAPNRPKPIPTPVGKRKF